MSEQALALGCNERPACDAGPAFKEARGLAPPACFSVFSSRRLRPPACRTPRSAAATWAAVALVAAALCLRSCAADDASSPPSPTGEPPSDVDILSKLSSLEQQLAALQSTSIVCAAGRCTIPAGYELWIDDYALKQIGSESYSGLGIFWKGTPASDYPGYAAAVDVSGWAPARLPGPAGAPHAACWHGLLGDGRHGRRRMLLQQSEWLPA